MGFKYTYKGVEHTVDNNTGTLTTRGKYLEDDIVVEAQGGGETEALNVTAEGTYTSANGFSPVNVHITPKWNDHNWVSPKTSF